MVSDEVDKREYVLQRAIEVFSARGYRATSMKDLADQVKLGKSTLYHYFRSKQDLLVAIYSGVMAENIAAAKRIRESNQSVVESVRQMLADRVSYTCSHQRILQIFHEEEAELPKRLMSQVTESRRAYQEVMTDLLEQGLSQGQFEFDPTPMIVANCLLGACNWSYKWYHPDGRKTPDALADEVSDFLMNAIMTKSGRSSRSTSAAGSAPSRAVRGA